MFHILLYGFKLPFSFLLHLSYSPSIFLIPRVTPLVKTLYILMESEESIIKKHDNIFPILLFDSTFDYSIQAKRPVTD